MFRQQQLPVLFFYDWDVTISSIIPFEIIIVLWPPVPDVLSYL